MRSSDAASRRRGRRDGRAPPAVDVARIVAHGRQRAVRAADWPRGLADHRSDAIAACRKARTARRRSAATARRQPCRAVERPDRAPSTVRDPDAPGVELGAQRREVRLVGERDVEGVAVDRPQLGQGQPDRLDRLHVLLGQRDVGDRRVVRVERDRHAGPVEAGERVGGHATARSRPASSRSGTGRASRRRAMSSAHSAGSSTAPGPCAIRSGSTASARRTCAAPPHSPAWSVIRRPPARAASNGARVDQRIREGLLGTGQVPAGQPLVAEPGRGLGQGRRCRRVVRAQRRADEPDDRPGPRRAPSRAPRADGRDPVGQRQPAARRGAAGPSGSRRSGRRRPPWSRPARP